MPARIKALSLTVVCGAATAAACAPGAVAQTIRTGGPAGPVVPAGTLITGSSTTPAATIALASGAATCTTGGWAATIGGNPTPSAPLTPVAFSLGGTAPSCVGPPSGAFRIFRVSMTSAGPASFLATPPTGTVTMTSLVLTAAVGVPRTLSAPNGTCTFTVNVATGGFVNTGSALTFVNAPISSATGVCATALPGTLSAAFGPLQVAGADIGVY